MTKLALYKLKRPYHFVKTGLLQAIPAWFKHRFPAKKLTTTTITGTDGKTTSATLLYHTLKTAGLKVGLLSTVAAYIDDQEIDTGFHVTSPQPMALHGFLRKMVDRGCSHLVIEVTSHGSFQYRDWGLYPNYVGITNVAHEHLDYHQNYYEYLKAKALILKKAPVVVLNADDQSFKPLQKLLSNNQQIKTYSIQKRWPYGLKKILDEHLPEPHNQQNALLAWELAKLHDVSLTDFKKAVSTFQGIPGRMEFIPSNRSFEVVVDFAHTPQGLEAALKSARAHLRRRSKTGRLIAVGGSAGLRDYSKRPLMGKIATEIADLAIFTAEDPRTEDVWSIIRQMKEGVKALHKVISIADRGRAIEFALNKLAKKNDLVVIFGKGHEQSMCYGTVEHPWDDSKAATAILKNKPIPFPIDLV